MPTGYTKIILDGGSLSDYVWGAAEVMFYDGRSATENRHLYDLQEHEKALLECQAHKAELMAIDEAEATARAEKAYVRYVEQIEQMNAEAAKVRDCYLDMRKKVDMLDMPPVLADFKHFLLSQIDECLQWEGKQLERLPHRLTGEEWLRGQLDSADRDCEYHAHAVKRVRETIEHERTWVELLEKIVPKPVKSKLDGTP